MIAMMGLYFLVLLSVGMLRPIRNALALDGLGQTDFYKVYLISGLVIVFVPLLNWLSDHVPWRRLIPGVALFFALNLLVFRALYVEGSTAFGLVFYGWYDLFAAALVTQLFMVTQLFFHARLAKRAYPMVIAGGALGASSGGAITGFLAEAVGTPNLLLLAAGLIGVFSVAVTAVWSIEGMVPERPRSRRSAPVARGGLGIRAIFGNRQVILIASLVLITILVKQLVDYQFNTITKEVFESRDAISAFQGKFNAATQWLPIVVLLLMRKPLQRWGVGFVVLILPVSMLLTNVGLVLFWGLWAAVAAKGAETSFRYSAERAGREILYLPVPDEIKLKAKAYIDVAVEKGVGKVGSALLIFLLLTRIEYQQVAWVGGALSIVWIVMALAVRREYVRSLASAVENRFASLHGVFASLQDASTLKVLRTALAGDERQVAFALDLLDQAPTGDAEPLADELMALLDHPSAAIRRRALDLLRGLPEQADPARLESRLGDADPEVREAAVRALVAADGESKTDTIRRLLVSDDVAIRIATLSCLARDEIASDALADVRHEIAGSGGGSTLEERIEQALVAGVLQPASATRIVMDCLEDPDPTVVSTALRSAGMLGDPGLHARLIEALGNPRTREAARDALAMQGTRVLPALIETLLDEAADRAVRRHIPSVLARLPDPATLRGLIDAVMATETDQILDHRAIKALSKLRARNPELAFPVEPVRRLLDRSVTVASLLASVDARLQGQDDAGPATRLLRQAVREAWAERREEAFRCLGLLHEPESIHRAFLSVTRGETVSRANALEWLESTVGFHDFRKLDPVLDPDSAAPTHEDLPTMLRRLESDEDRWIARCAQRAGAEMGLDSPPHPATGEIGMDPIETVFLLQQVDVLRDARSAHLALLGSIAQEEDADTGTILAREGEPPDALYVVIRGEVTLKGPGGELSLTDGESFGTWALVDDVPSLVEASAARPTRLLRIGREDFLDLLADHPELAIGMLQGLARRLRSLVL